MSISETVPTSNETSPAPSVFRVTHTSVSTAFLSNLIKAEQVKTFTDLTDLNRRMGYTHERRAIYAWPDPSDINFAYISVQVAKTQGLAKNIQDILDGTDHTLEPDTAIYYSISGWKRKGGGGLGKDLILGAAHAIQEEDPRITTFATLSPLADFRAWICDPNYPDEPMSKTAAVDLIPGSCDEFVRNVSHIKTAQDLHRQPETVEALMKLAAFAVLGRKPHGRNEYRAHNGVAHFHLGNGAYAGRLITNADPSPQGFDSSFGFMINYIYNWEHCEENATHYKAGKPQRLNGLTPLVSTASRGRIDVPSHGELHYI